MNITYVTETWPPEVNGVSLSAQRTVEYLRTHGHEVMVVRPRQPGETSTNGSELLVAGMPLPFYSDLRIGFPMIGRLRSAWRASPPDIVHVATEGPLGWAAVVAARGLGIAVTSDFRTRFDLYAGHYAAAFMKPMVLAYLRAFHDRCNRTFVPTSSLLSVLEAQDFQNLAVSPRGVDCKKFSPQYRSHVLRQAWGARGPVVLYVGRLAREKNIALVVRAFRAILAKTPEATLVVVGDGPMRAKLQRAAPEAIFCGVQRGTDLARHYASADVFLFPSHSETFGNVTLEAMASGIGVVAFDEAAAGMHIRDGINGCVVASHDEEGFVARAVSLVSDSATQRRLGSAARETAQAVTWDLVLQDFQRQLVGTTPTGFGHVHALVA